jgi:hypothetical protein
MKTLHTVERALFLWVPSSQYVDAFDRRKRKNLPLIKKVASRIVMKTLRTVERGCSLIRMHRQTQHPRSKKKKYLPLIKKSSLPDCHENTSHRGAGLLINTDAPSNATSKIKEQEKIVPSSKK